MVQYNGRQHLNSFILTTKNNYKNIVKSDYPHISAILSAERKPKWATE